MRADFCLEESPATEESYGPPCLRSAPPDGFAGTLLDAPSPTTPPSPAEDKSRKWASLLFSFHGRVGRGFWWLTQAGQFVLLLALGTLGQATESVPHLRELVSIMAIFGLAALVVINLIVNVRRLHDIDASGWNLLRFCIPILGTIVGLVVLGFIGGTLVPNGYDRR